MSVEIPEDLQQLPANSGIYAIWMIFHHYGIDLNISDLVQLTKHDDEAGVSTIAIAVALKTLGLDVDFYTQKDDDKQPLEHDFYTKANAMQIPVYEQEFSYSDIREVVEQGRFVIVFYDTLEGVGNHSLVYDINDQEIEFFDTFEPMQKEIFEAQHRVEGICQQVIVIDDRNFVMRHS